MKPQAISTEFYLILFVVCVGFVILLMFSGMVKRVYRTYRRKYRRRKQKRFPWSLSI
jgi:hypothetical protein